MVGCRGQGVVGIKESRDGRGMGVDVWGFRVVAV